MIFAAQSTTDTSYYFNRYIFQNISMRRTINLKKGLNLSLAGGLSSTEVKTDIYPSRIAVIPDDFPGFTPKLDVAEGETVGIGQPIMHDKTDTDITIVSPVEGTVESIVRGARRKIERVLSKLVRRMSYQSPTLPRQLRQRQDTYSSAPDYGPCFASGPTTSSRPATPCHVTYLSQLWTQRRSRSTWRNPR